MKPAGLIVVMRASHLCCGWRGVRQPDSKMISSVLRGRFIGDSIARAEAFQLFGAAGL